jgi:malate dehydrogenase (oxaloacetate-decarboxylating)(NADP+)
MEVAAVRAIAELAQMEQSDVVAAAYGGQEISFGPNYLIPRPFDPRLILHIAPAVAKAAADSGVATRPVADLEAYRDQLQQFVYQSGAMMRPIFSIAKHAQKKRIVYAEGEDERVLRAVRVVVDEHLARPILVGRPAVIAQRVDRFGLRLQQGRDYEVVNTDHDERYREFWQTYQRLAGRKGVTPPFAKIEMRRRLTLISAMMLHKGEADGMICGTWGNTHLHLHYIDQVIGKRPGAKVYAAMNGLILPGRQVMLVDTHINLDPSAEDLAEITLMAAEEMRRFGIAPKVALLSHSNFGSSNAPSALKMRQTLELLHQRAPDLEVDGEMHGDCAFDPSLRSSLLPETTLSGEANLLVFPGLDAANIAYNLLKATGSNNVAIGPILLGAAQPVNILTASSTVRRIVNVTALTVMDANSTR